MTRSRWAVVIAVAFLLFAGWAITQRFEVSTSGARAVRLDRWTGEVRITSGGVLPAADWFGALASLGSLWATGVAAASLMLTGVALFVALRYAHDRAEPLPWKAFRLAGLCVVGCGALLAVSLTVLAYENLRQSEDKARLYDGAAGACGELFNELERSVFGPHEGALIAIDPRSLGANRDRCFRAWNAIQSAQQAQK